MITRLHIQNFKAHGSTKIELGRFMMLVGDNASGKSSVLDALWLVSPNRAPDWGGDWAPHDLLRRGADGPVRLSARGSDGDMVSLELPSFKATLNRRDVSWQGLGKPLGRAAFFNLHAETIAAAAYSPRPDAIVESDGTNTAVVLEAMKLGDDEAFDRVEAGLRRLVPAVDRVRLRRASVTDDDGKPVVGHKIYFDFHGAPGVPAHNASHGTLIALSLLTILHSQNRPNILLLDDLDHALHPRAQMELVRMLKELLTLDELSDLQIVATTHSPYILDELEPSEVQAFALRGDGTVATKRLSEHPDAERMKGSLRAGQLWTLDPERDWILGDRAA